MANNYEGNFPSFSEYLQQNQVRQDRQRYPFYTDNADYNTNSKSYYDDLARKNKLIEIFAKRIWEYDEELAKRFEEWDKNLEELPEDLRNLLIEWMEDGTLEEIINDNIFNKLNHKLSDVLDTFYYSEIITTEVLDGKNKYIINKIPPKDENGEKIVPKKEYDYGFKTVREFATKSESSLSINTSIFDIDGNKPKGVHVSNGEVIKNDNDSDSWVLVYDTNTQLFNALSPVTTGQDVITNGYSDAWTGFYPIIMNGDVMDSKTWAKTGNAIVRHSRQVLTQLEDKTILIFTFRGREDDYEGYTYDELIDTLMPYGVDFAYVLDGGGSVQTVKDNLLINPPLDEGYKKERPVFDAMSFIKTTSKKREDIYKILGDLSVVLQKLEARHISKYGDVIPGKLWHDDSLYIKQENSLYSYIGEIGANAEVQRMIGTYKDGNYKRLYIGTLDNPLSIQASHNINVQIGSDDEPYRIQLEHPDDWIKPNLLNGWQEHERPLKYKDVNNFETRLSGVVKCGTQDLSDQPIFVLPEDRVPSQPIVTPCSTLSAERQTNDIIVYPNGNVMLRYPVLSPTENTAISIELTFYRGI